MKDRATILGLLNKFSNDHTNVSWTMKCSYSDGMGTTTNQIRIVAQPDNRIIGIFSYRVETGVVSFCAYKKLDKAKSENIIDMLLDMINYSKGEVV